jgi:hypothetical protein
VCCSRWTNIGQSGQLAINIAAIPGVTAEADSSNRLVIYADSDAESDGSSADGGIVVIAPESTAGLLTTLGVTATSYYAPALQQSPNYTVPRWRTTDTEGGRPTGSVWNKTTAVNQGTNIVVKEYDSALATFITKLAPVFQNDQSANATLDPTGGGRNIAAGTLYTQYNVSPEVVSNGFNDTFTLQVFERLTTGSTIITGDDTTPVFVNGNQFTIQTSTANSSALTAPVTATIVGTTAADFVAAVSAAGVAGVSATVTASGSIAFTQSLGGVIVLNDVTGSSVGCCWY